VDRDLVKNKKRATGALQEVLDFYKELPFNSVDTYETAVSVIKSVNQLERIYPQCEDFWKLENVLEIGCGAGWLSNTIAYYYGIPVTAIDFNRVAIQQAEDLSKLLNVNVEYQVADLFNYQCEPKDMVLSVGVLHHTNDMGKGIKKCIELTKPHGKIFIGLYHQYGRAPFLEYFKKLKEINSDENFLFSKYIELDHRQKDGQQSKSWFLDQVMHPYETQHTLKEVYEIFEEMGVKLIATSINHYEEINDVWELFELEKKEFDIGMEYLRKNKYYPGFFYVLGEKN